ALLPTSLLLRAQARIVVRAAFVTHRPALIPLVVVLPSPALNRSIVTRRLWRRGPWRRRYLWRWRWRVVSSFRTLRHRLNRLGRRLRRRVDSLRSRHRSD